MRKLFLAFAVLILCASCSGGSNNDEPLTVGLMPDYDSIPILLAEHLGYFENVNLELYKSPLDRDSALFAGGLDGTISDLLQACMANDKGFPVRITSRTVSLYGVIASQDSGVTSLADLSGRTAGLSLGTVIEYVLDTAMEMEGADSGTVEKSSVPQIPTRLELVSRGQIDSIAVPEPYVTAAEEAGGVVLATSGDYGLKPGVIIFTQDAIDSKSKQIDGFNAALNKAYEYINTHDPEEFFPAIKEEMGLPDASLTFPMPTYEDWGLPTEADVTQAQEWLLSREMISAARPYADLIYE